VWVVPNSVELGSGQLPVAAHPRRQRRTVAMVGRAAAQKGVRFFIKTVRLLDPGRFRALWIGGGDPAGEAELRAAGVTVTGWLPREQVLATLREEVDIYFHTARWEGTPVTLLEAAALQLPIVARRIPHLVDVPVSCWAESPAMAARALTGLQDATVAERVRSANEAILARFSAERTQEALLNAYRSVLAAREDAAAQRRLWAGAQRRRAS
jgi:glycosyltransferase involved in cell wall biosynthesis